MRAFRQVRAAGKKGRHVRDTRMRTPLQQKFCSYQRWRRFLSTRELAARSTCCAMMPPQTLWPQVLVARGFGFCDEGDEPEQPQFPAPSSEELHECVPLLLEGVDASSTDAPSQGIGEALGH